MDRGNSASEIIGANLRDSKDFQLWIADLQSLSQWVTDYTLIDIANIPLTTDGTVLDNYLTTNADPNRVMVLHCNDSEIPFFQEENTDKAIAILTHCKFWSQKSVILAWEFPQLGTIEVTKSDFDIFPSLLAVF